MDEETSPVELNESQPETNAEPLPEEKDRSTLYFIVIAVAVIGAAAFFYFSNTGTKEEQFPSISYNGFVFQQYAGLWNTQWQEGTELFNLRLHYNPSQVENISIYGDEWSAGQAVYLTFDPDDTDDFGYMALAVSELSLSLKNAFGIIPLAACAKNHTGECANRPIITCKDSSQNVSVIYLKKEGETLIDLKGNCAIIQGEREELVRATEKVIYRWYGIIRAVEN